MFRLKRYPSRSSCYYVRGTIGKVKIFESTKTADLDEATKYLNKRSTEIYRENVLSGADWTTASPEMVKALIALAQKANNRIQKKKRGFSRITPDLVTALYLKQRGRCAVSGIPFRLDELREGVPHTRAFSPSLDRIDNARGYAPDNVRLVCRIANFAMNIWGDSALLELALGVATYWEATCREDFAHSKTVQRSLRVLERMANVQ